GDVEECIVTKVQQGGFTPLPDAVCWVVLQLGASGQNAIYQTAQGYFVTTPDSLRLGEYPIPMQESRSLLMSTTEALTMIHGEITTIREGSRTHQGIQTNLADVICGGNKNDKILVPRMSSKGHHPRKLERRHSMRLLGSSRRLATLHRAGSVRLLQHANTESSPKKCSLLSRIFRWPKRQNSTPLPSFSAQFPPQEWFNSTVLHLHSVGTQTQAPTNAENDWTQCAPSQTRRRSLSTSRLPRRHSQSRTQTASRPSSPSTASSKTVICHTTPKSMSSASSGYNSLPRSVRSKNKQGTASAQNTPKCSPRHSSKNSIKVEVSANTAGMSTESPIETRMNGKLNEPSAMLTTTINGPNATKIYVQQHNSPMRSVITVENAKKPTNATIAKEKVLVKEEKERANIVDGKRTKRPSSLYQQKEKPCEISPDKNNEILGQLEKEIKMKFPSSETIQLEEKLLQSNEKNNKNLCLSKELFDPSNNAFKAGSLVDVANYFTDAEKNNVRKASLSLSPLQPAQSNDKVLESLCFKNVLKDSQVETFLKKEGKNLCPKIVATNKSSPAIENKTICDKQSDKDMKPFPSLSDLSVHFTSIAAQNILNGVSLNSIDTLVEVNAAAEKQSNREFTGMHTDLGVV
ncbi:hypothetical protein AAG570_011100, partial [Ranatra chinensis]